MNTVLPNSTLDLASECAELRRELALARQRLASTEHAFGRFVPRQFLQLLSLKDVRDIRLGMQAELKMSILFSDIRDFTSMSETMTPQENFNFLNSYLSQMEPVISLHRGIIDKYIGDAIMALFPSNANDAIDGALGMLTRLDVYNESRQRANYPPVQIGIGINSGIVMLGTIGGNERMDSTVISDAVNLASRLEHMTKHYGVPLLISEHTLNELDAPQNYNIRFIDRVVAKGKLESQSVYEVFDADPAPLRAAKQKTLDRFQRALAYYHMNHIARARLLLQECLEEAPEDNPAKVYLALCDETLHDTHYAAAEEVDLRQQWMDEYNSGVEFIDTANCELLGHMNLLISSARKDGAKEIQKQLELIQHKSHVFLSREEALMRETGYPFTNDHIRQHKRFAENINILHSEAPVEDFDPVYFAYRIKLLMIDWLSNHSIKFDRHLGLHLRHHGKTL